VQVSFRRRLPELWPSEGHKLISQSVALPSSLAIRWISARCRFVIKRGGLGGRTQRHQMCLLGIACPFAETPLNGTMSGLSRAKRRWRNRRISRVREMRGPGG
jgi:hypothetical protein